MINGVRIRMTCPPMETNTNNSEKKTHRAIKEKCVKNENAIRCAFFDVCSYGCGCVNVAVAFRTGFIWLQPSCTGDTWYGRRMKRIFLIYGSPPSTCVVPHGRWRRMSTNGVILVPAINTPENRSLRTGKSLSLSLFLSQLERINNNNN